MRDPFPVSGVPAKREAIRNPPDYESAETALDDAAQTAFNHGFGFIPSRVQVILRANTATKQGWADNEEMEFTFPYYRGANGVDMTMDSDNIYITMGAELLLLDHTTFNHEWITSTEYDWVVKAWK